MLPGKDVIAKVIFNQKGVIAMHGFCPLRRDVCNTECAWYCFTSNNCAVNVIAYGLDTMAVNDAIRTKTQNGTERNKPDG